MVTLTNPRHTFSPLGERRLTRKPDVFPFSESPGTIGDARRLQASFARQKNE